PPTFCEAHPICHPILMRLATAGLKGENGRFRQNSLVSQLAKSAENVLCGLENSSCITSGDRIFLPGLVEPPFSRGVLPANPIQNKGLSRPAVSLPSGH